MEADGEEPGEGRKQEKRGKNKGMLSGKNKTLVGCIQNRLLKVFLKNKQKIQEISTP